MSFLDFANPLAAAIFGGENRGGNKPSPYVQQHPVPVHLTLPTAQPDWNTATVKIPAASQHGWSGNSLQSYLQTFQRGGGPATGQRIATTQSLFPNTGGPVAPDWGHMPKVANPSVEPSAGQSDIIQSLVKNSVGGEMSPAAAALYGRMLGATPPPAVAATQPVTVKPVLSPYTGGGNPRQFGMRQNSEYSRGLDAGRQSLYKGMTPLQKSQANAVYNVAQPASPSLI
jgi:hypothetical protein